MEELRKKLMEELKNKLGEGYEVSPVDVNKMCIRDSTQVGMGMENYQSQLSTAFVSGNVDSR